MKVLRPSSVSLENPARACLQVRAEEAMRFSARAFACLLVGERHERRLSGCRGEHIVGVNVGEGSLALHVAFRARRGCLRMHLSRRLRPSLFCGFGWRLSHRRYLRQRRNAARRACRIAPWRHAGLRVCALCNWPARPVALCRQLEEGGAPGPLRRWRTAAREGAARHVGRTHVINDGANGVLGRHPQPQCPPPAIRVLQLHIKAVRRSGHHVTRCVAVSDYSFARERSEQLAGGRRLRAFAFALVLAFATARTPARRAQAQLLRVHLDAHGQVPGGGPGVAAAHHLRAEHHHRARSLAPRAAGRKRARAARRVAPPRPSHPHPPAFPRLPCCPPARARRCRKFMPPAHKDERARTSRKQKKKPMAFELTSWEK